MSILTTAYENVWRIIRVITKGVNISDSDIKASKRYALRLIKLARTI